MQDSKKKVGVCYIHMSVAPFLENFSFLILTRIFHIITESNFMSDGSLLHEYTNPKLPHLPTGWIV